MLLVTMEDIRKKLEEGNGTADFSSQTDLRFKPDITRIDGNLILDNSFANFMSDELTINGDLHLNNASIELFPNDVRVTGNFYATNASFELLSKRLIVIGNIIADGAKGISVVDELNVKGNAIFTRAKIDWLPKDTIIGGNLDISDISPKTHISHDICVNGDLICKNCNAFRLIKLDNIGGNIIKR